MLVRPDEPRANPLRELRFGADVVRAVLRRLPARSRGASGAPVLVIPGFATSDAAMTLLHRDLQARGFSTHEWGEGINCGPRGVTLRKLAQRVRHLARSTGRRVHLVGWSLGGLLARIVAGRTAGFVGRVVTLGSPLSGDPTCSWLSGMLARAAGRPFSHRSVRRLLAEGKQVPVASIYSRNDGVVHWRASVGEPGVIEPIEVSASHLGMVVSPAVFDAVAGALLRHRAAGVLAG